MLYSLQNKTASCYITFPFYITNSTDQNNLLTKTLLVFGNSPPLRAQNLIGVLTSDHWNLA